MTGDDEELKALKELLTADRLDSVFQRICGIENHLRAMSAEVFTPEDVELIKAHVRHPGALEAAKLKERIAAAMIALETERPDTAFAILSAP